MQAVYQLDVQGNDLLGQIGSFFRENEGDDMVRKLAMQWTAGTWGKLEECDRYIGAASIKWQLSRLSQVDRSILRISTYQLLFCEDIPGKVVINEAIELAKKFGSRQSSKFVNGVLDAILRKIRQNTCEK